MLRIEKLKLRHGRPSELEIDEGAVGALRDDEHEQHAG
jgi:hypothetical protein